MRLAAAIGVIAITLAAALYIHQRRVYPAASGPIINVPSFGDRVKTDGKMHPSWEDPAALFLAIGGIAVAAGILTAGRRSYFVKPSS